MWRDLQQHVAPLATRQFDSVVSAARRQLAAQLWSAVPSPARLAHWLTTTVGHLGWSSTLRLGGEALLRLPARARRRMFDRRSQGRERGDGAS